MKLLITALLIFVWSTSFSQNCWCDKDSILNENIDCNPIKFENNARLYWSFNCDSSWLTFESPKNVKKIIFSLSDGLQELTERLGYIYVQEYKHTFLIQCNVISGCCTPPNFYLYDKTTGIKRDSLGALIFYSVDKKLPFILSISDDYNHINIYNVDSNRKYLFKLPKGEIKEGLRRTKQINPEYLFSEPVLKGTTIYLTYSLDTPENYNEKKTKTIIIDLRKYLSSP